MNISLGDEAIEFGAAVERAIQDAGGDNIAHRVEDRPESREPVAEAILSGLDAWDLQPRQSTDDLEAAAVLCRAAGYWNLPYPVAERLARPDDLAVDGLVVISERSPRAPLAGTGRRWASVTINGDRRTANPAPDVTRPRHSSFVVSLEGERLDEEGAGDVPLGLMLPCWSLLGMLDRAVELTVRYVRSRRQFGQSLSSFQGVQFQLTDAEVQRAGLAELAKHALWSSSVQPDQAIDDGLALRLVAIEAADVVFRVAHQLHGAIGFCDEMTLSWLSRYSQPIRRLPFGLSETREQLAARIDPHGLSGLFDPEPDRSDGPRGR